MAEREISVFMQSKYTSDVSKQLRNDQKRIEAFQRVLDKKPLRIPIKLDYTGAMGQVSKIRAAILGEFAKVPASILGADGRPASAGTTAGNRMNSKAGTLSSTETAKWNKDTGRFETDRINHIEQLGRGLTELSKFQMKDGSMQEFERVTKRVGTNVEELRQGLLGMKKENREAYGVARGKGDKLAQAKILTDESARLNQVLGDAKGAGLEHSPLYQRGERMISAMSERIATLDGRLSTAAEKSAYKDATRAGGKELDKNYRDTQEKLKANKIEEARAGQITNTAARESALNSIYADRKKIFEDSRDAFRAMDIAQQKAGRNDIADRAMRAGSTQHNQANQVDVERARMDTERAKAAQAALDKQAKKDAADTKKSQRIADAAAKRTTAANFDRGLRLDGHATKLALQGNDRQQAGLPAIPGRLAREAELNRILADREQIHRDSASRLGAMQARVAVANPELAAKAEAAKLKAEQAMVQVGTKESKAQAAAQVAAAKEAKAAKAKVAADASSARQSAFNQEMANIKRNSANEIAEINAAERKALASARNNAERRDAAARAHRQRINEYSGRAGSYLGVENRAKAAGEGGVATAARGSAVSAATAATRDTQRLAAATTKSGHALNFHTSSLLKNAATFARWMIPVQGVLALTAAFRVGVQGAIKVDRQFATLSAVFRGNSEEVQRLKNETLELAVAQGRSTDEAMDSSIRWSRLGLTRIQVLEATRVSLMAANVAEISAAEAAEKLSGIYATYRLNVSDLAGVLNRLNSISNNYNVTVDDLFQGISRVSGVAKQSGLALRDLEGMIGSVVGAGGGSGSEVGNAIKFVISRLGDTKVGDKLKKAFDIDLTGPNGDLKDMSQIMAEMAALYPTLNKAQQQSFLQMASGARQASRFSKVMTEYRQGQILAAKAGFDHAASLRENENILQSLQSRIDSLSAAWTGLFTTMGDAGAFDFVEKRLRGIQNLIMEIRNGGADPGKKRPMTINDTKTAETVENIGGDWDSVAGTRDDFSKESIQRATLQIDAALKERQELIKKYGDRMGNLSLAQKLKIGGGAAFAADDAKISEQRLVTDNPNTGLKWQAFSGVGDAEKTMQKLLGLLESGGDSGTSDEVTKITNQTAKLRDEMESFPDAAGVFDSLGDGYADGTVDRETMIKQFQAMSYLITQLDGGQKTYNDSLATFNQLLVSGDKGKMQEFLKGLGGNFRGKGKIITEQLREQIVAGQGVLGQKLAGLEQKKAELSAAPIGKGDGALLEKEAALTAIDAEIKNVTSGIESLNTAASTIDDVLKSAFNPGQVSNINKYFEDLKAQAEAVGEAFKDFAVDAANDPVDRIFQRRRQAAGLALEWSRKTLAATNTESYKSKSAAEEGIKLNQENISKGADDLEALKAKKLVADGDLRKEIEDDRKLQADLEADARKAKSPKDKKDIEFYVDMTKERIKRGEAQLAGPGDAVIAKTKEIEAAKKLLEEQQKIVDQNDEAVERAKTQVRLREEELEIVIRKLEYEERIADVQRAFTDGARQAGNSSQAWRFGETESDKDRNQAQVAIERANQNISSSWDLPEDNFKAKADLTGRVMQDEATARAALESMERRQYDIDAARKQVAIDTVKAMKEQTEEASKRLMLASREDQLRASALARTLRDNGPVGDNEFFALSQESRQAFTNYLPNQAPDLLNDAKTNGAKARRELDAEQARITSTIGDLRGALDDLAKRITEASKGGGSLDIMPAPPPVPVQDTANTPRDKSPLVNVQVGDVSVNVQLGAEVERIMTGYVDRVLMTGLREMELRLTRPLAPTSQGATE